MPTNVATIWLATLLWIGSAAAQPKPGQHGEPIASMAGHWQARVGHVVAGDVELRKVETAGQAPGDQLTLYLGRKGVDASLRVFIARLPTDGGGHGGRRLRSLLVLTDPRQPDAAFGPAIASVVADLRTADRGQFANLGRTAGQSHGGRRDPGGPPTTGLMPITWLLLALSLLAVPLALRRSLAVVAPREASSRWRQAVLLAPLAALLIRALAPHRLVMVYFGYLHVDQAVELTVLPRYGAATAALYHGLFQVAPAHHLTVQWLHVVLGALSIWPLAALVATWWTAPQDRCRAAALASWTVVLLPMSVLDHGSESILVPALLWWLSGTVMLDAWMSERRWWRAAAAATLLTLCGLSRPDCMALALPSALVFVTMRHGRAKVMAAWLGILAVTLGVVLLSVPGALFLSERTAEDAAMGNLPHLGAAFFQSLPRRLWNEWVIMDARYFPRPLTWLAALGVAASSWPGLRRRLFATDGAESEQARPGPHIGLACLALLALAWAVPMLLDFNETSMLRLHAPSASLAAAAGATTMAHLMAPGAPLRRITWRWRAAAMGLLLVGLWGGYAMTIAPVFADQNSVLDDRLLAQVAEHSHDGQPAVYITRSYDDPPDHGIHLLHPAYLLEEGDRWLGVHHLERQLAQLKGERLFWVAGLRCFAHELRDKKDPGDAWLHPACASFCARHECKAIWTKQVGNAGERGFAWYPRPDAVPAFKVGLYQVGDLAELKRPGDVGDE